MSVFWSLCVSLLMCMISNQSASKSHVICVKITVNLTPCCIKHIASYFWYKVPRLDKCRSVISFSKITPLMWLDHTLGTLCQLRQWVLKEAFNEYWRKHFIITLWMNPSLPLRYLAKLKSERILLLCLTFMSHSSLFLFKNYKLCLLGIEWNFFRNQHLS